MHGWNTQVRKTQVKIYRVEKVSTATGRAILTQIRQKNITANPRNSTTNKNNTTYWIKHDSGRYYTQQGCQVTRANSNRFQVWLVLSSVFIESNFRNMQCTRIAKGSGYKYAIGNNVFNQYCVKNNKRYVKCDMCNATGFIEGDTFLEVKQHTQHKNIWLKKSSVCTW